MRLAQPLTRLQRSAVQLLPGRPHNSRIESAGRSPSRGAARASFRDGPCSGQEGALAAGSVPIIFRSMPRHAAFLALRHPSGKPLTVVDEVFGALGVLQDPPGGREHEPGVAVVERAEGLPVPPGHRVDEVGVGGPGRAVEVRGHQ